MADQYLLGTAMASFLMFFLLVGFWGCKRKAHLAPGNRSSCAIRAGKGNTGTDVIVVGAGVAGSALAYTLGKVRSTFALLFDFSELRVEFFDTDRK